MTSAVTAASAAVPSAPQGLFRGKQRVLASAFVGTTIEWYDFYLYGTAAALVFNVQFFPMDSELGSLLASFATLAVGFFARPLGGIIAGHLGDRVGRKALLVVSLMTMGIASTLIGLMPTYEAIGWWAAAGLVVLRIFQGLSAGAEWGGSALLSVEHAPVGSRGLFGSFTQIGSAAGMLLATSAFFVVQAVFTDEQFAQFGWRIPFLASALLVVVGLWIRLGVSDAPEFIEHKESGNVSRQPLWEVVTRHPRVLLVTIGLRLAQNSVYYLITVYMLTYLADRRGDASSGIAAVMIASGIGLVTGPLWGWVSDRVGRRTVTLGGIIGIGVFGWIFFAFLENGPLVLLPIIVVLGMNLAHDAVYGPQAAWFAEQFPVEVRYSGVNMGYQLGTVIGGGIMPMIAALLFVAGGSTPWLICAYLTLLCVLSGIAAVAAHDPARAEALVRRRAPGPAGPADSAADSVASEAAAPTPADTHRPIQESSHR